MKGPDGSWFKWQGTLEHPVPTVSVKRSSRRQVVRRATVASVVSTVSVAALSARSSPLVDGAIAARSRAGWVVQWTRCCRRWTSWRPYGSTATWWASAECASVPPRARARLDAELLRRVRVWDDHQRWAAEGALSPSGWLTHHGGLSTVSARRLVALAHRLGAAPVTEAALQVGSLSVDQAAVVARAHGAVHGPVPG